MPRQPKVAEPLTTKLAVLDSRTLTGNYPTLDHHLFPAAVCYTNSKRGSKPVILAAFTTRQLADKFFEHHEPFLRSVVEPRSFDEIRQQSLWGDAEREDANRGEEGSC